MQRFEDTITSDFFLFVLTIEEKHSDQYALYYFGHVKVSFLSSLHQTMTQKKKIPLTIQNIAPLKKYMTCNLRKLQRGHCELPTIYFESTILESTTSSYV